MSGVAVTGPTVTHYSLLLSRWSGQKPQTDPSSQYKGVHNGH